jgi:ATP-dependent Lon protease
MLNLHPTMSRRLEKNAATQSASHSKQTSSQSGFLPTPSGPFFAASVSTTPQASHFQALQQIRPAQVRFGSNTPATARLIEMGNRNATVKTLLVLAKNYAKKDGQDEIGAKHLLIAALKAGNSVASQQEVLNVKLSDLNPTQGVGRQAVDALVRPDVRKKNGISGQQIQNILGQTLVKLENSYVDPQAKAESGSPFVFESELEPVLSSFFQGQVTDDNFVSSFVSFFATKISDTPGMTDDVKNLGAVINKATTDANRLKGATANQGGKIVKPTDEPEIPIYKRDTSNEGFKKHADELHKKGLMSDYQYSALRTMLEKPADGGFMGGQMDGGVTKKRLTKYLYEFGWKKTADILDPEETRRILDEDHAFLDDVKEEIVNYIRRLNHLQQRGQEPRDAKIICLVGPPGVGKTSIAMSVARATNRKMGHISLSNLQHPSDLVGHSSTYVNAQTGRLFKAMVEAGSVNPILVLDEVDKLSQNSMQGGNVANVLLPILDPKQNHKVVDEMLGPEMPLDLSKTMFIVTANDESAIPEALRDRMEIIRLDGYDVEEKQEIAKNHLIPSIKRDYALEDAEFDLTDEAIQWVVKNHTREAGVRGLNRKLKTLADQNIAKIMTNKPLTPVDPSVAREMLGVPDIFIPAPYKKATVGRVNGLAVTGAGSGAVMSFLTNVKKQKAAKSDLPGTLQLTDGFPNGNLKKVTEESARHAFEWAETNFERLGVQIPDGQTWKVAIAPERGAVEKDGDSAGAAMTTALVSALTGKPIRSDVAMTGTITIHGRVLAIGGVKQKLRGALEGGMKVVFVPQENANELDLLPKKMKETLNVLTPEAFKAAVATNTHTPEGKLTVVPVEQVEDVLNYAIEGFSIQ